MLTASRFGHFLEDRFGGRHVYAAGFDLRDKIRQLLRANLESRELNPALTEFAQHLAHHPIAGGFGVRNDIGRGLEIVGDLFGRGG